MALMDLLLNRLKAENPEGYKRFMAIRNSGKDPITAMRDMYRKGEITSDQLDTMASQARRLGISIPKSEIEKIKAVDNTADAPRANPFKGLF